MHVHMCRKDNIFRQRQLNHSGAGRGIAFRRVYPARAYTTLVVLVNFVRFSVTLVHSSIPPQISAFLRNPCVFLCPCAFLHPPREFLRPHLSNVPDDISILRIIALLIS